MLAQASTHSLGSRDKVTSALHWRVPGTPSSAWQLRGSGATSITHGACRGDHQQDRGPQDTVLPGEPRCPSAPEPCGQLRSCSCCLLEHGAPVPAAGQPQHTPCPAPHGEQPRCPEPPAAPVLTAVRGSTGGRAEPGGSAPVWCSAVSERRM